MDNASALRLTIFLSVFAVMALLEAYKPAREAVLNRKQRWMGNLSMVVLGAVVARLLLPATLLGLSSWAASEGVGLFNSIGGVLPFAVVVILCVLIQDVVIYWQHRLFHTVPVLWRIHKMHHADSHVDTTTGLRFHPIEIALSLCIKAAVVVLFGVPALAIVIFEIALNAFSLFNHANIRLPEKWDKRVSTILVTQRLHRIHHSQAKQHSNTNYGFSVTWWDKLFNSFTSQSRVNDATFEIGQKDIPAVKENASVLALLKQPFNHKPEGQ
jgi:sterol desaturase/sphingolipid hydroxylase (fatty acid hydroxylase superfamily)